MKKVEFVRIFKEVAATKKLELTHGDIDTILSILKESIIEVVKLGESVTLDSMLKISTKEVGERKGVTALPGKEPVEWKVDAHTAPVCKFTKAFVDEYKVVK